MTSIASVSQAELSQRRRMLRRQRRLKLFQALWRTSAVCGLAGGLVWTTTQPFWVLRESNQIVIEGNQLLSAQAIQSLVPLSYPQSLLRIEPEAIARSLESQPPIAEATVTRQLFPPSLTVQVKERVPVAIALTNPPNGTALTSKAAVGLLDANGVWMPLQSYNALKHTLELPKLKVIGTPEQYRPYWTQMYPALSHSPVRVIEVDCHNPTNLILKTELGIVHLGPYSSRFAEQLNVLDQMRQLPTQLNNGQIAYINLKNPDSPSVQMNQPKELVKSDTP